MTYKVFYSSSFKRDIKRCQKAWSELIAVARSRRYLEQNEDQLYLLFTKTGTHSDIF